MILIDDMKVPGFLNFNDLYSMHTPQSQKKRQEMLENCDPDSAANIQFTSGTTSKPKAVTLSHFNILNNSLFIGHSMNYTSKDVICIPVPLYHCFGMVMGVLAALNHSSGIVLPSEAFDPASTLQAV